MKSPIKYVAMISLPLPDRLPVSDYNITDIAVYVSPLRTENGKTFPINWGHSYDEPKSSNGGLWSRVFRSSYDGKGVFGAYGPALSYAGRSQYEHAARALARVEKKTEEMRGLRGPAADAADEMGRWLEAAGVSEVWVSRHRVTSSLADADWQILSPGQLVCAVRSACADAV